MKRYTNGFRRPFFLRGGSRFVLLLIVAILCILFLRTFLFTQIEVRHSRSDLGLLEGDHVIVDRTKYGLRLPLMDLWGYHRIGRCEPDVGDIIVYDYPDGSGRVSLDRVVGVPGDTLWLEMNMTEFTIVPENFYGVGSIVLPERCIIGSPSFISYSVDSSQPFYQMLRPGRLFIDF